MPLTRINRVLPHAPGAFASSPQLQTAGNDAGQSLQAAALDILRAHSAHSLPPTIDLATGTLDSISPALEQCVGDLLRGAPSCGDRRLDATIDATTRAHFCAAIEKREALAPTIFIPEPLLAQALRDMLGLSAHLLPDQMLLSSLPRDVLEKIRRVLVSIAFPADTRPTSTRSSINLDQLHEALSRTGQQLECWRHELTQRLLGPLAQQLGQAREDEQHRNRQLAGQLVQMSPAEQAAALDALEASREDDLLFCARRSVRHDADYLGVPRAQWAQLHAHLQARETASRSQALPLAALHAALQTIQPQSPAAERLLACILIPPILLNRLKSSLGSSFHLACQDADHATQDALSRMADTAALQQHLQQVSDLRQQMQRTTPDVWALFEHLLGRLLETPGAATHTPLPKLASQIQAGLLQHAAESNRPMPPFLRALAGQCQEAIENPLAHWQDTPCRLWLQHARLTAQSLAQACSQLGKDLRNLGIQGIPALEKRLLASALNPTTVLADAAKQAFTQLCAAGPAQQAKIRESLLQKNGKTTPAALETLKQMRNSDTPARATLAGLIESLANRLRAQAAPPAKAIPRDEENLLIQQAIEDAQADRSLAPKDATVAEIDTALDQFLTGLPTTGSLEKRANAVARKLDGMSGQEIIELGCALLRRQLQIATDPEQTLYRKRTASIEQLLRGTLPTLEAIGQISESQLTLGELRTAIDAYLAEPRVRANLPEGSPQLIARRALMCTEQLTNHALSLKKGRSSPESHEQNLVYACHLGVASYVGFTSALQAVSVLGRLAHSIWGEMLDHYADTMPGNVSFTHAIDHVGLIYAMGEKIFEAYGPLLTTALEEARTQPQVAAQISELLQLSAIEIKRETRNSVANEAAGYVAATLLRHLVPEVDRDAKEQAEKMVG